MGFITKSKGFYHENVRIQRDAVPVVTASYNRTNVANTRILATHSNEPSPMR